VAEPRCARAEQDLGTLWGRYGEGLEDVSGSKIGWSVGARGGWGGRVTELDEGRDTYWPGWFTRAARIVLGMS
jgi:hypothetical protein